MSDSDLALLNRFYRDSDTAAIEEFISRNREAAWRYAQVFTDADLAEDIVQIAIVRLLNAKPANGKVSNAIAWLRAIVYSVAIDQVRSESKRADRESGVVNDLNSIQKDMDLESTTMRTQLLEVIREEIGKLAPQFREPLIQRYFKGLSYREIANTLQLKTNTVSTRLARGLHQLTLVLSQKGLLELSAPTNTSRQSGEGIVMPKLSPKTIELNRRLAERWHELWAVSNQGLGRFTSVCHEDGTASITWREDCPVGKSRRFHTEYPDQANERRWVENTICFTDATTMDWSRLTTQHGRVVDGTVESCEDYELVPSGNKLTISRNGEHRGSLQLEADGPIITNSLLPVVIREHRRVSNDQWPIRMLGLLPQESRESGGSDWALIPVFGRYAGQIGKPMSRGHLYEIGSETNVHMEITILTSSGGRLTGCFWEEEGYAVVDDEESARAAYIASQN